MGERTLTEAEFRDALRTLAEVCVKAFSLRQDLAPLTAEDIELGAEPLTQEQIHESLDSIQDELTKLALNTLHATREEWLAANDTVQ